MIKSQKLRDEKLHKIGRNLINKRGSENYKEVVKYFVLLTYNLGRADGMLEAEKGSSGS
jgi:hypothetical protein